MNSILVVTTVSTRADAQRIAQALVERALAACAQIAAIESLYVWDGVLQNTPEFRIELKTTADRYAAVAQAIRELHPYRLPDIHAIALAHVDAAYAAWVDAGSHAA